MLYTNAWVKTWIIYFIYLCTMANVKAWRNWPALFAQHQYLELGHFLFASFASSQICMAKLASKQRTGSVCLSTSKNVFDLNQKHFCSPTCKMCLPNMKCLTNLVVAKRTSKDRLLKLSHVRQRMLVSFARP